MDGVAADFTVQPHRGIVAGGSTATFEAKARLLPTMQEVQVEGTGSAIHIDDLAMRSLDEVAWSCILHFKTLALETKAALDTLRLPLSLPKVAIVGSSASLVRRAQAALGELAVQALWVGPKPGHRLCLR